MGRGILDALLPPLCPSCKTAVTRHQALCSACFADMEFLTASLCESCGVPFPLAMPEGTRCAQCVEAAPSFTKARAVCAYNDVSRTLITRLKYADQTQLAPFLGNWMARHGAALIAQSDLIAPVPLHRRRLFSRMFNQSLLIARAVAKETSLPLTPDLLIRRRHTEQQTGKSRLQRRANVKGAFVLNPKHEIRGQRILLVDDVMTTGATVEACARTLKKTGAAEVYVLTFARTGLD